MVLLKKSLLENYKEWKIECGVIWKVTFQASFWYTLDFFKTTWGVHKKLFIHGHDFS